MTLAEAKLLYDSGAISDPIIYKPRGKNGWCLQFSSNQPVKFKLKIETERGSLRIFKNINAAIGIAEKIGVSEVKLILKN